MKKPSRFSIKPYFTQGRRARDLFSWKTHHSRIRGADGQVYFEMKKVRAPDGWSSTAVDIAASKYFRKSVRSENSIEALVERVGRGLESAARQSGLFRGARDVRVFVEEIKYILYAQKAAFNSPVWFNLGLREAYGLSSRSEHYSWNARADKILRTEDAYLRPQTSACFIQSVDDTLESIFDLVKSEAKLFKYGSGSGTNFSRLRSRNELLSSGGTSSGLISFLDVLDKAAGAIKSGGTTRRAAKMVCVDLDHPEIEDFIRWKWDEEKKAAALVREGYSSELDGDAYRTISGQNANNSVRVPDRFMKSLGRGKNWKLLRRSDGKVFKTLRADDLWRQICEAAWHCADPGLQFDDTINRFHTCAATARIRSSNPCSEYMFLDDSACNLASLNLTQFLDGNQNFMLEDFVHTAQLMFIAQECLVDFASYPTEKIAQNSHDFRPLGLGFANLGSFCMRRALAYDSDEARAWAGALTAIMTGTAYATSVEMAGVKGSFAGYRKNKKAMAGVMNRHRRALKKISWRHLPPELAAAARQTWDFVHTAGARFGFRNAQATVIAPTGTIGLIMDCDTTGIEPDFSLIKNKKLAGGGYLKIVNQSVGTALQRLGYHEEDIDKILVHVEETGSVLGSGVRKEHQSIFACATGDLALAPEAHLQMMAAVQPFISGAISKTVNLPNSATVGDIGRTYEQAWKLGLKSVAIYRDGSKFVQPLSPAAPTGAGADTTTGAGAGKRAAAADAPVAENAGPFPRCTECGYETVLESGCYRCTNCGTTTACAS